MSDASRVNDDPLSKSAEDYADVIDRLSTPESPVGIDAKYTHAVIIEYLRRITAKLESLETRLDRLENG